MANTNAMHSRSREPDEPPRSRPGRSVPPMCLRSTSVTMPPRMKSSSVKLVRNVCTSEMRTARPDEHAVLREQQHPDREARQPGARDQVVGGVRHERDAEPLAERAGAVRRRRRCPGTSAPSPRTTAATSSERYGERRSDRTLAAASRSFVRRSDSSTRTRYAPMPTATATTTATRGASARSASASGVDKGPPRDRPQRARPRRGRPARRR